MLRLGNRKRHRSRKMAEFQRHAPGGTISQVLKRVEHRYVKPLLRKLKPWRTTTKYAGGFTSKRISMAAAQPSVRISYRSPTSAACPAKTARSSGARVPGLSVFRCSPSGFATRCGAELGAPSEGNVTDGPAASPPWGAWSAPSFRRVRLQSVRATPTGSIPAFCHHARSSPAR